MLFMYEKHLSNLLCVFSEKTNIVLEGKGQVPGLRQKPELRQELELPWM